MQSRSLASADFDKMYDRIEAEVANLHEKWEIYKQLYAKENIDLLNEVASSCFYIIHYALVDDIILSLCRLCDPPNTGDKENCTLQQLIGQLNTRANSSDHKEWEDRFSDFKDRSSHLKTHRNKRIAHIDKMAALSEAMLPAVSKEDINIALSKLSEVMNAINRQLYKATRTYQSPRIIGDGNELIFWLKEAKEYRENHGYS